MIIKGRMCSVRIRFKFCIPATEPESCGLIQGFFSILLISIFCISCLKRKPFQLKSFLPVQAALAVTDPCTTAVPSEPSAVKVSTVSSPLSVSVIWTNPKDCIPKGAAVVRKEGSVPADRNDGVSITVDSGGLSFTDSSIVLNTLYYYKIFLYNSTGIYSKGTSVPLLAGSTTVIPVQISDNSIVLDGQDSDSAWSLGPKISFSFPVVPNYTDYTGGGDPNVSGYIRFAYDSSNFYIFYHTDDKYLRTDDVGSPWTDDSIEVFFDMGYGRTSSPDTDDFQFIFTTRNGNDYYQKGNGTGWTFFSPTVNKAVYSPGTTANNDADIDSGWNMEMQIPFSVLGVSSISSGRIIGFTFYINDDDLIAFSGSQHMFTWTNGTVYNQPNTWGILQF